MSWLPDPMQLAAGPQLEEQEIDFEEEPPTPDEIFEETIRRYPDSVGHTFGINVDVCRFDGAGNHTAMAKHCPHFDREDEEGPKIMPGWTVQGNRQ